MSINGSFIYLYLPIQTCLPLDHEITKDCLYLYIRSNSSAKDVSLILLFLNLINCVDVDKQCRYYLVY